MFRASNCRWTAPRGPRGGLGVLRRAGGLGRPLVLDVGSSQLDAGAPEQKGRGDPVDAAVTTAIGPRGRQRVGHRERGQRDGGGTKPKQRRLSSVVSRGSRTSRMGPLDASSSQVRPGGRCRTKMAIRAAVCWSPGTRPSPPKRGRERRRGGCQVTEDEVSSPGTADDHDDRTQRRGLFKGVNSRGRRGRERCDGLSSGQEDRLGGGRQSSTIHEMQKCSRFQDFPLRTAQNRN